MAAFSTEKGHILCKYIESWKIKNKNKSVLFSFTQLQPSSILNVFKWIVFFPVKTLTIINKDNSVLRNSEKMRYQNCGNVFKKEKGLELSVCSPSRWEATVSPHYCLEWVWGNNATKKMWFSSSQLEISIFIKSIQFLRLKKWKKRRARYDCHVLMCYL